MSTTEMIASALLLIAVIIINRQDVHIKEMRKQVDAYHKAWMEAIEKNR